MLDEQEDQIASAGRLGGQIQAIRIALPRLKRMGKAEVLLAVVGLLILGELTFRWTTSKGWITYTEDDGLANNDIWSIVVAPNDVLWVTTGNGVSRLRAHSCGPLTTTDRPSTVSRHPTPAHSSVPSSCGRCGQMFPCRKSSVGLRREEA